LSTTLTDYDDAFYLRVASALASCQMVEFELKAYISDAFAFATKAIDGRMSFKFSGDDYIDAPLERLIEAFRKLSDDDELIKRLNAFKRERNFLTHRGVSHCINPDGELSIEEATEYQERLASIEQEASMLLGAIRQEAGAFQGHLYFDDVSGTAA
jgi:hypothetical protein